MNEQEMQFASPDWQPSPGQAALPPGQEQDIPQPVNTVRRGWPNEENGLDAFSSAYAQGYQGEQSIPPPPPMYQQTPVYQSGAGTRPRPRRRFWLWIVIIFFLFWLIPTTFGTMRYHSSSYKAPAMDTQTYGYDMTGISTLRINIPNSSIHVHGDNGGLGPKSQIQEQSEGAPANSLQFIQGKDGTLTIQESNLPDGSFVQLDITLPGNIALDLQANNGDIEVDSMSGQVNLQANNSITLDNDTINSKSTISTSQGDIHIANSSLSGEYTITGNSGQIDLHQVNMSGKGTVQALGDTNISMSGTLDPQGVYSFTSDSGGIDLTLPDNTAMQLNIDPGTGHSSSAFPTTGTGTESQARVNLKTNSGDINVDKDSH